MSNTQYIHVFEVSVRLGKGAYAVTPVSVISFQKELPAQRHDILSYINLESLAKAFLHCKNSGSVPCPLELVDHTKGCKVQAEVNRLLEGGRNREFICSINRHF